MTLPSKARTSRVISRSIFALRNPIAAIPLVYALESTRWEWENGWGVWTLATLSCFVGSALRCWASGHCYYGNRRLKRLAKTGPYRLVRNPLYVGNLFIIAGATIASELAWFLPISVAWAWCIYSLVCSRYEEGRLLRWYGDEYRRYRSEVPAWLPRLPVAAGGLSSFPWRLLGAQAPAFLVLLPFALKEWTWAAS